MWATFGLLYVGLVMRHRPRILRAIEYVGIISYSLYLLHWPILVALHRHPRWLIEWPGHAVASGLLSTALEALPLTMLAATLTYRVIEKPPLDLRRRYASFAPAASATDPATPAPVAAGSDV